MGRMRRGKIDTVDNIKSILFWKNFRWKNLGVSMCSHQGSLRKWFMRHTQFWILTTEAETIKIGIHTESLQNTSFVSIL